DGDGKPDVATANYNSDNLSVLRNTSVTGAINFTAKADFTAGDGPYSIAIGDIDGDGKPDVAIANDGSSDVSLFRNTSVSGSINFDAKADFATNLRPKSVAFGDIDGDAKPDVVVAAIGSSNSLSVFRNTSAAGSINLAAKADFAAGSGPYSVAIGDLDGDGRPDLASANTNITPQNNYTVSVLRNADIVPSISVTGNLTGFVTCTAIESAEQSITVNGNNLTADITVAAPTGFEVSTTSGNGFGSSVMLTQTAGTVSGTTVYVRLSATATGTPAGNLTIESTGATTQNKAVSGIVNTGTFTATAQGACDSYTWSANNQTYTASGTYIYNYNNDNGCASADTLYLTINTGTFNSTTASACNSYIWVANGITYTTGGIYIYNYNNANGCASADTLKLTLASDNPEICNGIDDNCNGLIDEGLPTTTYYLDADGDGYGTGTGAEYCSNPGAGFATQGGDCNDNDNTVYPNAPERCDSKDNNCNGQIDEDCFASKISINDVSITEGNLKQKTLRFTVSLSDTSSITIKVNYATQNVTATAPGDYVAQSGTLTFAPGKLKRNIKILINGDKTVEPNETFNVVLSNPVNANITKATGTGTILNNDGAAIAATAPTSSDAVIETNAVIMPNPASSISNVKLKGFSGLVTVQLINVQGKTLLQQKLQTDEKFGSQIQLNVSNIPNGLYFISIIDNKGTHRTEKLIVQH
ncbi:MAG TPA: FG-GAP-like repeat-containing protein, partial [Panacibacter sp.]|nr:FG-GAP-like repeat-containing protein [Panacibacter sp.]